MRFEYEIPLREYVAAQTLFNRSRAGGKGRQRAFYWILVGLVLIAVACNQDALGWGPVLLGVAGAWWLFWGFVLLFPWSYLRRAYRGSGVEGKKYQAEVNEERFEVNSDLCSWRVRWEGVSARGEDKLVFMCYAANTVFTFGKKYLTAEQQAEFRRLAGFPNSRP